MKKIVKQGIFTVMLSGLLAFAACKSENDKNTDGGPVKIVGDSLSPTGSDGLGREIDTVQRIERHLDSINNLPQ